MDCRSQVFGVVIAWLIAGVVPRSPFGFAALAQRESSIPAAQFELTEKPLTVGEQLMAQGYQQLYTTQLPAAIASFQQALEQFQAVGDRAGAAAALLGLAEAYLWSGQYEAELEAAQQAFALYEAVGDRAGAAAARQLWGDAQLNLGEFDAGVATLQETLALRQAVQDRQGEGWTLGLLGIGQTKQGDAAAGLATMQQAIAILNEPVDPVLEQRQQHRRGVIWAWIGYAYLQQADYPAATKTLQQALTLGRTMGNRSVERLALFFWGDGQKAQGQFVEALTTYEEALALAQALGNVPVEAAAYVRIGNLHYEQEQHEAARTAYQRALVLYENLGDLDSQGWRLYDIGYTYKQQGQFQAAAEFFRQALTVFQEADNLVGKLNTLSAAGYAYESLREYEQSRVFFQQQIELAQQTGNLAQEAFGFRGVGSTYLSHAQFLLQNEFYAEAVTTAQQAVAPYQQAINLAEAAGFDLEVDSSLIKTIAIVYSTQAFAWEFQQQFPEAIAARQQALEILEIYRDRLGETDYLEERLDNLGSLAGVYRNSGQHVEAIAAYREARQIAEQLNQPEDQLWALHLESSSHAYLGNYAEALATAQQMLAIVTEALPQDEDAKVFALIKLGQAYGNLSQYADELAHYQQALAIAQASHDIGTEVILLNNIATVYTAQGNYRQALAYQKHSNTLRQQAVTALQSNTPESYEQFCRDSNSEAPLFQQQCLDAYRYGLAVGLSNLVSQYQDLGRYPEAIAAFQQALVIAQQFQALELESSLMVNVGSVYQEMGNYAEARTAYERALEIATVTASLPNQAIALNNLGHLYSVQGQYPQALAFYQRSLKLAQDMGDAETEANVLGNIGAVYESQGRVEVAREFYQQALAVNQAFGVDTSTDLNNLAVLEVEQGREAAGLDKLEQALVGAQASGSRLSEAIILGNLADIYAERGDYTEAIQLREQVLTIYQDLGARPSEIGGLLGLGRSYYALGQYDQALMYYQQALDLSQEIGQRSTEAVALGDIGQVYLRQGQPMQARDFLEQGLAIVREIGNVSSESALLDAIGQTYQQEGAFEQAMAAYQQALVIDRAIGFVLAESKTLRKLGVVYGQQNRVSEAMAAFQQALTLQRQLNNPVAEAYTLGDFAAFLAAQEQPELAIVFYKQSVNLIETIRANLRGLPNELQQSYTDSIAGTYRQLADLLLQQNRVLEAQQVLDLLRVQELDDYLQGVRGNEQTEDGVELLAPEIEIENRTVAVGYELAELRAIPYAQLSTAQRQRLAELDAQQRAFVEDFQGFIDSAEVQALIAQLSPAGRSQDVLAELDSFINLQDSLRSLNQDAVLIYPLILEDRLELVLVTPFSEPTRYSVDVSRAELNAAIVAFRQALDDPLSDPKATAQQLYQWLMAPMVQDLAAVGAETILYAPDGALRYVPLAALHDGEQWLVEEFRINHITAASLQNFTLSPATAEPRILAAAFTEGQFEFEVGQRSFLFGGLPFAGVEVEILAANFPATTTFLNEQFNRNAVEPAMDSHTIVHLATHAAFVPGSPADSFILFGNGDRLSLAEIRDTWQGRFNQVELMVLSACETGLGSDTLGNGEEILGFGYLMQEAGVNAAIASLWQVSDAGTQVLVTAFYEALEQGKTKVEALQAAQVALIQNSGTADAGGDRGGVVPIPGDRSMPLLSAATGYRHPYYWAPFILIGNGL